jgi:hypothetical protein
MNKIRFLILFIFCIPSLAALFAACSKRYIPFEPAANSPTATVAAPVVSATVTNTVLTCGQHSYNLAGSCVCDAGWFDCDGDSGNGCENSGACPSLTGTPTITPTLTHTSQNTVTYTHTPRDTETNTVLPSGTATSSLTAALSGTDTATASHTVTITPSKTNSSTATQTPTVTLTIVVTPAWETVGYGVSTGIASHISINVYNGEVYAVYHDAGLGGLAVRKYNGSWSDVGSQPVSSGGATYTSIQVDPGTFHAAGDVYAAFTDVANSQMQKVYHYDGVSWTAQTYAGNTVTAYAAEFGDLYIYGSDMYYAYRTNAAPTRLRVLQWTGSGTSGWEHPGGITDVYPDSCTWPVLSGAGGNLYVAFRDSSTVENGECSVKIWNGSTWADLGLHLNTGLSTFQSIYAVSSSEIYVCYMDWDSANYGLTTSRWNGSAWSVMGTRGELSTGTPMWTSLKYYSGMPFVSAVDDGAAQAVKIMEWTGSAWQLLAGQYVGYTEAGYGYNDMGIDTTGGYCYSAYADKDNSRKLTVKRRKLP